MTAIRFINILLSGLISGALFVIWIGYNPKAFPPAAYLEQQQNAINSLNTLMPVLELTAILITVASAIMQKRNKTDFAILLTAAILLVAAGIVTRFGNQPLNRIVMTWKAINIPSDWSGFRDKWMSFHIIRTFATFLAFCLITYSSIRKT